MGSEMCIRDSSYFGASVIHPRTLQPLQKKHIPLYVRSFVDLAAAGSTIDDHSENDSLIPSFIIKPGQVLISMPPRLRLRFGQQRTPDGPIALRMWLVSALGTRHQCAHEVGSADDADHRSVLDDGRLHVVGSRGAVGCRGALVEHPRRAFRSLSEAAMEDVFVMPETQGLALHGGQVDPLWHGAIHDRKATASRHRPPTVRWQ